MSHTPPSHSFSSRTTAFMPLFKLLFGILGLIGLVACQTSEPQRPPPPDWQLVPIPESQIMVAFPPDWYLHAGGKMVELTPHSQPLWSSVVDPADTASGPHIQLLHNLNRQMGETPEAEIEFILHGYTDLEPHQLAAPLPDRPDIWLGSYRFAEDPAAMLLLVGVVDLPRPTAPQPIVDLVTVVSAEELAIYLPIFEQILRSIQVVEN